MKKTADFIIVGAGYAGLMCALTLAKSGADILVVDAQPIGGNQNSLLGHTQSAISGGHVVVGFSQDFDTIEKKYGVDYAYKLWRLSVEGLNLVEKNCTDMGGAGFLRGYHILARNKRDEEAIIQTFAERKKYGILESQIRLLDKNETKSYLTSPEFQGTSLYSTLSGQLEPKDYVMGLARMAEKANVKFKALTRISKFNILKNSMELITESGDVLSAPKIIISGGSGVLRGGFFPVMRKYQAVVGNYALKTEILPQAVIDKIFPSGYRGAFSDMRRSDVLYARLDNQKRLDFGAYSFSGNHPNSEAVIKLLYKTFPQLLNANISISEGRYGFLVGTRTETMQLFQSDTKGRLSSRNYFDNESPLTILSAFGAAGINLGTTTGYATAEAMLGNPEKINLLARIEHPKLPVTFPWEGANQWRDYTLTKALSIIDIGSSNQGFIGAGCRLLQRLV